MAHNMAEWVIPKIKDGPVINLAVFEVLYLSSLVAYRLLEA